MGNATTLIHPTLILPGGCTLALDALGLPASDKLKHSPGGFCTCTPWQFDAVVLEHMVRWQTQYAAHLQIDPVAATELACRVLLLLQVATPEWFYPIAAQWINILHNAGRWDVSYGARFIEKLRLAERRKLRRWRNRRCRITPRESLGRKKKGPRGTEGETRRERLRKELREARRKSRKEGMDEGESSAWIAAGLKIETVKRLKGY